MKENHKKETISKKIKSLQSKAEKGDSLALFYLGIHYYAGKDIKQDYKKAFECFQKVATEDACNLWNAQAQFFLGKCYFYGYGKRKNITMAIQWYKSAEKLKHQLFDYKIDFDFHENNAKKGNAISQNLLGDCYFYGEGVPQNYAMALKWYKRAAEQDFMDAQWNLGYCYSCGFGIEKNMKEARKWFRKAKTKIENEINKKLFCL